MTKSQRITLAATGLGLFMIYLDALIVNVALPVIQSDFKVGEAGLQWVVTAYSLGMAIAIMSSGTAADIYGRRKLYLGGIALFTAASAAIGIGPTLGGFMVQRIGWRSIFMVNVPVGLVILALTWRFVTESRDERPRR